MDNRTQTMPYTYENISICKDVDDSVLVKDWNNLVNLDTEENLNKYCGNKILYKYQFKNILNCRRGFRNYKTLEERFETEELQKTLWNETLKRDRNKGKTPRACDVYECHRLNKGAIVCFKAATAKYIYSSFDSRNVLDPCAGWGGRLLGASSLDIEYTGIDTNINMKSAYDNMKIDGFSTDKQKIIWKSLFDVDFRESKYDLVLTSPPYFNVEIYEHSNPYSDENDYFNNFLIPMINKLYEETTCPICINISPEIYETLTKKYNYPECDYKINLKQQETHSKKTKKKRFNYIYIWRMIYYMKTGKKLKIKRVNSYLTHDPSVD